MAACDITGRVRNNKGEFVDSKLYNNLKKIIPVYEVDNYYNFINSDAFKLHENYKHLEFDELGEPTINSLIANTDTINTLMSERVAEKNILNELSMQSAAPSWNGLTTMLNEVTNLNDKLSKETDGRQAFRVAVVQEYDPKSKHTVLVPRVYKADSTSIMWEYKMKKILFDLQSIRESQNNNELSFELINDIARIVMKHMPSTIDEINALNENVIYNIVSKAKKDPLSNDNEVDTFKIASKSPLYERLANVMLHAKDADLLKFIRDNDLRIDLDDFAANPEKYYNLIMRTAWNKYQTNKAVLDYILDNNTREGAENLMERLRKQTVDMWAKVNFPDRKEDIKVEDNFVSEINKQREQNKEYFISTDKLIKELGESYNILDSSKTATIKLLKKIIEAELNQRYVQTRANVNSESDAIKTEYNQKMLEALMDLYEAGEYDLALYQYYVDLSNRIKKLYNEIDKSTSDIMEQARILRKAHLEMSMFRQIADYFKKNASNIVIDIPSVRRKIIEVFDSFFDNNPNEKLSTLQALKMAKDNPLQFQEEYLDLVTLANAYWNSYEIDDKTDKFKEINDKFILLGNDLDTLISKKSKAIVIAVFNHYQDEAAKIVPWGKDKGKVIDIEDLLSRAERDMWGIERLLDSMATSPDMVHRLIDKITKQYKNTARLEAVEFSKKCMNEAALLEDAGIKDTKWMFARDANGNKTGKYIMEGDEGYDEIMSNDAKRRWYKFFMENKAMFDNKYPPNTVKLSNIINIRKDLSERLKDSQSVKEAKNAYIESIKDEWMNRDSNDDEIVGYSQGTYTLEGEEINVLPIFYQGINFGNQSELNAISEDTVSTLIAYGAKAFDYNQSNKIINVLELSKEILKDREIPITRNGKKVVSYIKRLLKTEQEVADSAIYYKDSGKSNLSKRLQGYFDMVYYGKTRKDDTNIGKFSAIKIADKLNAWTARASMSLSLLNGFSNVTTGNMQIFYETMSKHHYKPIDITWANGIYAKHLIGYLGNLGKRIKTDKLSLFSEMFDVSQKYDKEFLRNTEWDRKTKFGMIEPGEALMFTQNAGEHWMSHQSALAVAHTYMFKDKDGNKYNLWDALEVKFYQKDGSLGNVDQGIGAKLQVRDGLVKEDGTAFTNNDIIKIQTKIASINHGMHGIYNGIDANMIQMTAVGRLAYLFRKWMWESYRKRVGKMNYNYDIGEWEEGYYRSCWHFMCMLSNDVKQFQFNVALHWNELSDTERANCKKTLIELMSLLSITLFNYMFDIHDGNGDDDDWAANMFCYQMIRLQSELSALTPVAVIPETIRMFKSPLPAITTVNNILDTFKALWIPNWFSDEITHGWAKGHSKGFRYLFGNKVLNPYFLTIYRNLNAEEETKWYLQ